VRAHDAGISVKYNDILFAIRKINNNGIDPSTVNLEFKAPKPHTTHSEEVHIKKSNPSNTSNKDFFDWDINQHKEIISKMDSQPVVQTTKNKFIFESTVFKKDASIDNKKSSVKKLDSPSVSNGNILTWKGTQNVESPIKKKIKDPNAQSTSDEGMKAPKKRVTTMHESSEENGLVRKK